MALSLLVAAATAARAQEKARVDSAAAACRDTTPPGTYDRCAYWLDGGWLRRGPNRLVIAKSGWFAPMPLGSLVQGDSAQSYALFYEHTKRRATKIYLTGILVEVAGAIVLRTYDCHAFNFGRCGGRSDARTFVGDALVVVSLGTVLKSLRVEARAYRAQSNAIRLHNARYAH